MAGGGVSNSFSGTIVLHQLHRDEAPIVHELAHIVAGYDNATGHWTQEGFASFVQDRFGSNPAYPTFRAAHGLAYVQSASFVAWLIGAARAISTSAIYDRIRNFSRGRMGR